MPSWIKPALQYSISLALGGALMWYVFQDADFAAMYNDIRQANFSWIFLSFVFALISHAFRAYRWNLLMEPLHLKPSLRNSFLAVMVGYLANIVLPRMGEVTRCAILQRTDKIPVNTSFGTVVTERLFDLISLIAIILVALVIEFDKLSGFVFNIFKDKFQGGSIRDTSVYLGIGSFVLIMLVGFIFLKLIQAQLKNSEMYSKFRKFSIGLIEGILSFRKLKKKKEFVISTIVIWACYFYMSYVIFFALPSTSSLGLSAGLAILVLGGLGMAAPVQGGMGAYHWIIQNGLVLYGLSLSEGLTFATIVHSSQMIMIIIVGLISLAASVFFVKPKKDLNPEPVIHEKHRQNINA